LGRGLPGSISKSRVVYPSGSRRLAHRSIEPMTLTHHPEEPTPGRQVGAGDSGECAARRNPIFRSQANAPCLQRSGRSYFR
jgi:hypothetical protein